MKRIFTAALALLLAGCSGGGETSSSYTGEMRQTSEIAVQFDDDVRRCRETEYDNLDMSQAQFAMPETEDIHILTVRQTKTEYKPSYLYESVRRFGKALVEDFNESNIGFTAEGIEGELIGYSTEEDGSFITDENGDKMPVYADPKALDHLDLINSDDPRIYMMTYEDKKNNRHVLQTKWDKYPLSFNRGRMMSAVGAEEGTSTAWFPDVDLEEKDRCIYSSDTADKLFPLPSGNVSVMAAADYLEKHFAADIGFELDRNITLKVNEYGIADFDKNSSALIMHCSLAWKGLPFDYYREGVMGSSDFRFDSFDTRCTALMLGQDEVDNFRGRLCMNNTVEETGEPVTEIISLSQAAERVSKKLAEYISAAGDTVQLVYSGKQPSDESPEVVLRPCWKFSLHDKYDNYVVTVDALNGECGFYSYSSRNRTRQQVSAQ